MSCDGRGGGTGRRRAAAQSRGGGGGDSHAAAAARAKQQTVVNDEWAKTGRNEPCPCGSGKKYKMCHGR